MLLHIGKQCRLPRCYATGLNALNAADIKDIQRDLAKIKYDAENSSKVVDENGELRMVYHGRHKHQRLTELDLYRGYNTKALWHAADPQKTYHRTLFAEHL